MNEGNHNRLIGKWGEDLTAEYLRKKGFRILNAGWHCRLGEIDLIATDEIYLCFVEVKLRKNKNFAEAREFVTVSKQRKVRMAAGLYLSQHPCGQLQPRFDVAEVYADASKPSVDPIIHYIENAF